MKEIYDVTIVSGYKDSDASLPHIPPEISGLKYVNIPSSGLSFIQKIIYTVAALFDPVCWREGLLIMHHKDKRPAQIKEMLGVYASAGAFWERLERTIPDIGSEDALFYTFWLTYKTFALLHNRKKLKAKKIFSRVHGVDLFSERISCGWLPLKRYMGQELDHLFFVSEQGRDYFCERYMDGLRSDSFLVSRLGVSEKKKRNPETRGERFRLVSCSNVIKLKRINLIIDALALIPDEMSLEWLHFGDGDMMDEVKAYAKDKLKGKNNITYRFMGFVENRELLQYYEYNRVDSFITTSSTEGLPVSIEEALSFGIAVIATSVGGIPETVSGNGVLLSADPDGKEVADAIKYIYDLPDDRSRELRDNSYEMWKRDFDSEKNNDLMKEIICGEADDK